MPEANPQKNSNGNQLVKSLKLISVSFKEAALDSPSFRASSNHLDSQVDNIETWLEAIIRSLKRYPQLFKEFKDFSNTFLDHLVPSFLLDGLIDQDYTVRALSTTLSGLKIAWNDCLKGLNVNESVGDILLDIIRNDIKDYRDVRHRFEILQAKYDKYLSIFASTPKTKDPATLREDAFQLLETRKQYIHISLDLAVELTKLGRRLDRTLVRLTSLLWKNKPVLSDNEAFDSYRSDINRISSWCDSYQSSIKLLEKDMTIARYQIEESAIVQFTPSADLNDHNPSLINANTLADIKENSNEKHGYLFMKTMAGKPLRPTWVKRWAFIKSGIFGLLILSPSKKSVQETDKIGILLCNVRYTPTEDRRFCFELKTIETTVIFQTETLAELKSWLKVFSNEKQRILDDPANINNKDSTSLGRYPPLLYEFASTSTTSSDVQLTRDRSDSTGENATINSSHLCAFLNENKESFENQIYHQIPQVYAPMITNSTKTAIIAYAFVSPTIVPSALTANIWGSVNWGLYYLVDRTVLNINSSGSPRINNKRKSITASSKLPDKPKTPADKYPTFYPDYLKAFDIQMKAIFETAVDNDEFCLISMRSIWSPNSKQQLSGRTFLTSENVFFYMNSLGFVSLVKLSVSSLVSVESQQEHNYDVLKIYDSSGQSKIKLFLDEGKLIRNKMNVLIQNKVRDHPKDLKDLIIELEKVEQTHYEQKKLEKLAASNRNLSQQVPIPSVVVSAKPVEGSEMRIDYRSTMSLIGEKVYNLPPKALFHVLLGDQSNLMENLSIMINAETLTPEYWSYSKKPNGDDTLSRSFIVPISYKGRSVGNLKMCQTVEKMVENQYYNIIQKSSSFSLPFSSPYEIENRVVIFSYDNRHSKLLIFSQIKFKQPNYIIRQLSERFHRLLSYYGVRRLDKQIHHSIEKIGNHGMVVKAIKLYGQLSRVEEKSELVEVDKAIGQKIAEVESTVDVSVALFIRTCIDFLFVRFVRVIYKIYRLLYDTTAAFIHGIKMNEVLILFLGLSIFLNIFLAGRTGTSYWNVKRADKIVTAFRQAEPERIQRAIYSKDVTDLLNSGSSISYDSNVSECYSKFKEDSFILNFDKTMIWDKSYGDQMTQTTAKQVRKTHMDIGVKRNELLVQLKVLNRIEEELAFGEWRNWLFSEYKRCQYVKEDIINNVLKDNGDDLEVKLPGSSELLEYCDSCEKELKYNSLL